MLVEYHEEGSTVELSTPINGKSELQFKKSALEDFKPSARTNYMRLKDLIGSHCLNLTPAEVGRMTLSDAFGVLNVLTGDTGETSW